jgi:hypothetical protein
MIDYTAMFKDGMNSLELRSIYFEELKKCLSVDEKNKLWLAYESFSHRACEGAMNTPNVLTSY